MTFRRVLGPSSHRHHRYVLGTVHRSQHIAAILLALGMFLDGVSMILIAASLLHPILVGSVRRIWIGVLMVKVAEGALITPQVLLFLSVCRSVTTANLGVPLERVHQFRDLPQVLSEHVDAGRGVMSIEGRDEFAMLALDHTQPGGRLGQRPGAQPYLAWLKCVIHFGDHRVALMADDLRMEHLVQLREPVPVALAPSLLHLFDQLPGALRRAGLPLTDRAEGIGFEHEARLVDLTHFHRRDHPNLRPAARKKIDIALHLQPLQGFTHGCAGRADPGCEGDLVDELAFGELPAEDRVADPLVGALACGCLDRSRDRAASRGGHSNH
ncbi:hypothetical protein MSMEI_3264 [Mycolicibacterium smegmatis MC2 155]|uniref:Uncharacterized protein n=1 Tax=Mycolicibacterium smegmatis (strain ATCC 700084 / mc(2)155) TaxID=246196 RepID=I7G1Q2_MYCS2|nr:hypothetical protein MSMEI_3264 [Mycolicibacterium smegmatis MC2 155]